MELVATVVLLDRSAEHWRPSPKVLDSGARGDHSLPAFGDSSRPGATVRLLLIVGLVSYIAMRVWSGLYFIPVMLAFQQVHLDSAPTVELSARVAKWTVWTWFREPLDMVSFLCFLLALYSLGKG